MRDRCPGFGDIFGFVGIFVDDIMERLTWRTDRNKVVTEISIHCQYEQTGTNEGDRVSAV